MGYVIVTECPACDSTGPHDLNVEIFDQENYLTGYVVHCRLCENVWEEWLGEPPNSI